VTFEELKELLFVRGNFGMKLGLDAMREALAQLGNPERETPALHVAGTNGKGSTCAFTEASLRAAGLRTGLYTSPHLNHFCERIRIGGEQLSEDHACALLTEIRERVPWALGDPGLTFFEIVTLMGFLAFRGLDVMVVEVGLGGRLDATNVLERPLACAVASLGLEHVQYLGPTLAHVASEKAGILKRGVPAVSAGQPAVAARVLSARAAELSIPLWRPGRDYVFESRDVRPFCYRGKRWEVRMGRAGLAGDGRSAQARSIGGRAGFAGDGRSAQARSIGGHLALEGHHQRTNAALACALLEAASEKLPVEPRHVEEGLSTALWPGRLELVHVAAEGVAGDADVYVDGAHNPHAAVALARSIPGLARGRPVRLVFGALQDKDVAAMLAALGPLAATVHYCAPGSPRAIQPEELAKLWPGKVHASVAAALQAARREQGVVLCAGSLYLVGEVRALLVGAPPARMPSERL
jgi:dihydrofolate synthase/folylpolyglutamate synthase